MLLVRSSDETPGAYGSDMRIEAIHTSSQPSSDPSSERGGGILSAGGLDVDVAAYAARLHGIPLDLSSSQVELLALLIRNRDRVLGREEIATTIGLRHARSVDVLLTMIRRSLGVNFVRTVRGRGWILDAAALS